MPMMTGAQYRTSIDDDRRLYIAGERVKSVADHPLMTPAVDWVAEGYDASYQESEAAHHPMFDPPESRDDLRSRVDMYLNHTHGSDMTIGTTSSGALALLTAAPDLEKYASPYADRLRNYFAFIRDSDFRVAEAITDSKGHRSKKPLEQHDRGQFVRVVERTGDGVVISGAKLHITAAPVVHEMIVMPTKQFRSGEEDYAIACAVPMDAAGVTVLNATYAPRGRDARDSPVSARHSMPDGFIVLDDVFVPNDRIFLDGEVEVSARLAHSLGLWERLGGLAELVRTGEELVGLALLVSEANGLERIPHIREKIGEIMIYTSLLSGILDAAIERAGVTASGMHYPDELLTNVGKYYGASNFSLMVRHLHDISGGAVVTAPSMADFENPETAQYAERYMATMDGVDGSYRAQLMHTIRDFTADTFGGWQQVTNLMSGGGLYAQRLVSMKHFDDEAAKQRARALFAHTL